MLHEGLHSGCPKYCMYLQHIRVSRHQHIASCLQTNGAVRSIVRKKAATCLLRLIRKSPPEAEILQPDVWSVKLVSPLVDLLPSALSLSYAHMAPLQHQKQYSRERKTCKA